MTAPAEQLTPACPECGSEAERIEPDPRSATRFEPFWRCTSCGRHPITDRKAAS